MSFFFSSFSHCNRIKHSSGKQLWVGTNLSRVQVDMVEWWCCSAQGPRAHRLRARLELISFYCGLCCFTPPTYFAHFPPLLPPNPPTHTRAHTRSRSARRHETLLQRRERAAGSLWNLFFFYIPQSPSGLSRTLPPLSGPSKVDMRKWSARQRLHLNSNVAARYEQTLFARLSWLCHMRSVTTS